ncbi:hypothetical protein D3C80_1862720 [compost metagenome]
MGHGLCIIHLAAVHVMAAGAATDPAIIEAQGSQTGVASAALQGRDDLVEHGPALHRIGMADQRNAARFA